jgi:hypothetical protein
MSLIVQSVLVNFKSYLTLCPECAAEQNADSISYSFIAIMV